jgi:hypothetical protein
MSEPNLTLRAYLRAFFGDWFARMSGPISVPFAAIAVWVSAGYAKILWGCLGAVCFFTASYRVWREERRTKQVMVQKLSLEITNLKQQIAALKKPEGESRRELSVSLAVVGTPPSPQMFRVQSNQVVKAVRLDYLLSTGTCIASDSLSLEGETFDVPIEDHQVLKLWNTPRADRNWNDHSGPAKLRLTLALNGVELPCTVPIQMDSYFYANTYYRKLTGAEVFRGG